MMPSSFFNDVIIALATSSGRLAGIVEACIGLLDPRSPLPK